MAATIIDRLADSEFESEKHSSASVDVTAFKNAVTGLLIPLYIYPGNIFTNADYNRIIALKKQYHFIPVTVVLNNSSGPGAVVDGNYTYAIKRLQGAGVTVIGYVSTAYGSRSTALINADVDLWRSFYPEIDGIFFDEMSNVAGEEAHYANLYQYAHDKGFYPIIGNPGAGTTGSYFSTLTADVIIIHETTGFPSEATLKGDYADGYSDYPYTRRAALIYGVETLLNDPLVATAKHVGMIYVSDDALPNPWDTLPAYLEDLFYKLAMIANGTGLPADA